MPAYWQISKSIKLNIKLIFEQKIDFLKLNKDKFVKQILTHPYPNTKNIGLQYAVQHHLMLYDIITIKIYKHFYIGYYVIKSIFYPKNNIMSSFKYLFLELTNFI
jgi:hypothetical protein